MAHRRSAAAASRLRPTSRSRAPRGRSAGPGAIRLWNPLAWARGGLVRLQAPELPPGEFELIDPVTSAAIVYQRMPRGGIEFIAPPVPARDFVRLAIRPVRRRGRSSVDAEWQESLLALHTSEYTLQFHPTGGLTRWHDRVRSTQWCSDRAAFPMGCCLVERPAGAGGFAPLSDRRAAVSCRITPLYARVMVEPPAGGRGGVCPIRRTTFTLYRGGPDLHVQLWPTARWSKLATYAFFPFSGKDLTVTPCELSPEINPPAAGGTPAQLPTALTRRLSLRLQGRHAGINLHPLQPGRLWLGRPGRSPPAAPRTCRNGTVYASLERQAVGSARISGARGFEFVLRPSANDAGDGGLARGAAEMCFPLRAAVIRSPGSTWCR